MPALDEPAFWQGPAVSPQDTAVPVLGMAPRFDHVELYVGNARQAAEFYRSGFGFSIVARRGLDTGNRSSASYLLQQGRVRLLVTSALGPDHPAAYSVRRHGDAVAVIGIAVDDAFAAHAQALQRGAREALAPTEHRVEGGRVRTTGVHLFGDVVFKLIERKDTEAFADGFVLANTPAHGPVGLAAIDHIVGNVAQGQMQQWADFLARTFGFSELMHFDQETISTEYSALQSVVMQDPSGNLKFPINEPAPSKRRSQIAEYLDFNHGAGVQHIACATGNIIETVAELRENGVSFLSVPQAYYDALPDRVGKIAEPIDRLAELGILVDRESNGYLLQIFTQPVEDRPTLFFEIIQRRGGARGFGEGNFKALFESIEREQARRGNL